VSTTNELPFLKFFFPHRTVSDPINGPFPFFFPTPPFQIVARHQLLVQNPSICDSRPHQFSFFPGLPFPPSWWVFAVFELLPLTPSIAVSDPLLIDLKFRYSPSFMPFSFVVFTPPLYTLLNADDRTVFPLFPSGIFRNGLFSPLRRTRPPPPDFIFFLFPSSHQHCRLSFLSFPIPRGRLSFISTFFFSMKSPGHPLLNHESVGNKLLPGTPFLFAFPLSLAVSLH